MRRAQRVLQLLQLLIDELQPRRLLPLRCEPPELARPLKRCWLLFGHPCRLFLGPGFRLAARWNRLGETVKTRKKREKTGEKWARYGLKRVKEGS